MVAIVAVIQWAMIRVVVNISRNLFKISKTLSELNSEN